MRAVRPLIEAVVAAGVPRAVFLRAARLDAAWLDDLDARLPRAKLFGLFQLALELTRDPAFGLHSMERMASDALNPIAALAMHAASLEDAIRSLQEFRRLFSDEPGFRLHHAEGKVFIQFASYPDQTLPVRRYITEVAVAGMYRLIRRFRADAPIDAVGFEYSAPAHHHEYGRIFDGLARFDQPLTGFGFDAMLMASAAPFPDPGLHEAMRAYAARTVMRATEQRPFSLRVREALIWQRQPRDLRMQAIARSLHVSVRSLRRYLGQEGKTYSDVVREALACIAKSCLLDEGRTIMDTARELGFADNTTFHRAFKRWTGVTPNEFRRLHARAAAPLTASS